MSTPNLDKIQILSKSFLFHRLSPGDLEQVARFAKLKRIAAKEVVFHKGETGKQMFAIVSGRLKISTLSEEGKEMVFGILEAGEIFGEISLLDGKERTATATAIAPGELLVIERQDFIPFLEQHPKVAINLLATLALRLRMTDELFEDTLFRNLPSRLAKKLLALTRYYGQETATGTQISLRLSQQEIGNLVGTSRESINKQLRIWEEEGLITFKNGYITIPQPKKLQRIAEFF